MVRQPTLSIHKKVDKKVEHFNLHVWLKHTVDNDNFSNSL